MSALATAAGTGHLLYPAVLYLRTRRLKDEVPPDPDQWPAVTVAVAAYLEEEVIAAKVADARDNGYPGPLEVLVVADDDATAAAARASGAEVLSSGSRGGKADAVNRAFAHASTPIVVLTDANTMLAPGSLTAMIRWFDDPSVGAVAGEKTVAGGEGAYWRFESWLKRREALTGSTIGLVGELTAVRQHVFRPLPPDLAVDDLWLALDVREQGKRIVYEPTARAAEEASPHWRAEWQRRTRVVSGVLDVIWRRRGLLSPRYGSLAAQLWGHRLMRSSIGPIAHLMLVLAAVHTRRRSTLAQLTVWFHLVGAVAAVRGQRRVRQVTLERLVGQTLFLQAVAIGGIVRYLRRDRPALWPKPRRVASSVSL
ncbi:MAG: glycosyltransferase [Actinomycetota bacterium]|nr:glycosyltransferase [Actinomycetota bacterium]